MTLVQLILLIQYQQCRAVDLLTRFKATYLAELGVSIHPSPTNLYQSFAIFQADATAIVTQYKTN